MNRHKISVIIPTKDRQESLKRCLWSLARQSVLPDEVVVVDNNSSDQTKVVVKNFKKQLPIKYVLEKKIGIPHARNRGINESSNQVLAFIDDDCEADKNWIASIHDAQSLGNVVLQGRSKNALPNNLISEVMYFSSEKGVRLSLSESILSNKNLNGRKIISEFLDTKNVVIYKKFFDQLGQGFDPDFSPFSAGEDTELGFRLSQHKIKTVYLPEMIVKHHYLKTFGSLMIKSFKYGKSAAMVSQKLRKKFADRYKAEQKAMSVFGPSVVSKIIKQRQKAQSYIQYKSLQNFIKNKTWSNKLLFLTLYFLHITIMRLGRMIESRK